MEHLSSDDKKKLFSMFKNMDISKTPVERKLNTEVLLVDGLNCFFRSFMAVPSMNDNGLHVGGIAGFLQSVGYAAKLLNPTRIVIVFDGVGGSLKRRKIYPDYKEKRKTNLKYNRSYEELTSDEKEDRNIQSQLLRLIGYLDTLPVTVMSVDHVEADDTIAYAANEYFKDSNKVYIMSTDKDYLQLVNDKINVWSPTKRKLYGCAEILLEYGISCENFINYRILSGDDSDNIDGVKGSGLKTVLKCFPELKDHVQYSLEHIYDVCEKNKKKYKLYNSILENKEILERNKLLMQLKDTQLQSFTQLRVHEILNKPVGILNRVRFGQLLAEDRMWGNIQNHHVWLNETFGRLITSDLK
jgi:DNA polymerase-1